MLCYICGVRISKKPKGRFPKYCDNCRKKIQDSYKKGKR